MIEIWFDVKPKSIIIIVYKKQTTIRCGCLFCFSFVDFENHHHQKKKTNRNNPSDVGCLLVAVSVIFNLSFYFFSDLFRCCPLFSMDSIRSNRLVKPKSNFRIFYLKKNKIPMKKHTHTQHYLIVVGGGHLKHFKC